MKQPTEPKQQVQLKSHLKRMSPPQNIELKLLGQKLVVRPSESDPEFVKQVVELVTAKLNEAELRSRGASLHHIALIALLDLAEEYLKSKRRSVELKTQVEEKASGLLTLIEPEVNHFENSI